MKEAKTKPDFGNTRYSESMNYLVQPLGFRNYDEYLNGTHWKEYIRKHRRITCFCCNSSGVMNQHHITYKRIGKELPEDTITVCNRCHDEIHDRCKKKTAMLSTAHIQLRDNLPLLSESEMKRQRSERDRLAGLLSKERRGKLTKKNRRQLRELRRQGKQAKPQINQHPKSTPQPKPLYQQMSGRDALARIEECVRRGQLTIESDGSRVAIHYLSRNGEHLTSYGRDVMDAIESM